MYIEDMQNLKDFKPLTLKSYVMAAPKKKEETPITINTENIILSHHADTAFINSPLKTKHKGFTGVYMNQPVKKDTNKIDINNYTFQTQTQTSKVKNQKSRILQTQNSNRKTQNYICRGQEMRMWSLI